MIVEVQANDFLSNFWYHYIIYNRIIRSSCTDQNQRFQVAGIANDTQQGSLNVEISHWGYSQPIQSRHKSSMNENFSSLTSPRNSTCLNTFTLLRYEMTPITEKKLYRYTTVTIMLEHKITNNSLKWIEKGLLLWCTVITLLRRMHHYRWMSIIAMNIFCEGSMKNIVTLVTGSTLRINIPHL